MLTTDFFFTPGCAFCSATKSTGALTEKRVSTSEELSEEWLQNIWLSLVSDGASVMQGKNTGVQPG